MKSTRHLSWRRLLIIRSIITLLLACVCPSLPASEQFNPEPEAIFTASEAAPWERVERLADMHKAFIQEAFHPAGHQQSSLIVKWFGGRDTPPSSRFLLHCAPGWSGKTFPVPILLVHGCADNANRAWMHPGTSECPADFDTNQKIIRGYAYWLSKLGYSVFAVTFAHGQGDNFLQAEQIADAIRRIRILMHKTDDPNFKVDVIAHSKGNVAARLYCSDGRSIFPRKTFLTPFRKDVRAFIAIACPFKGIDTAFRYYGLNLAAAADHSIGAAIGAEAMLLYGMWQNTADLSIYTDTSKNYFPGQCQLLYNLVRDESAPLNLDLFIQDVKQFSKNKSSRLPLGLDSLTPDAGVSMLALYNGGTSMFLKSRGIDAAIEQGERLIYRLEDKGLDPSIRLGVIAGTSPYITFIDGKVVPMPWEYFTPDGDGLLPLCSARATTNALKRGASLLGMKELKLNHLALACHPDVLKIIDQWLQILH
ncbi:MAG: hypothetical protein HQM09_01720 [Candidatus Riflebacteria bacterium]|nr:hypothetical protein [Candidatus Riflebacteria bacterium]